MKIAYQKKRVNSCQPNNKICKSLVHLDFPVLECEYGGNIAYQAKH